MTPRFMPFDFHVESFSAGPMNGKPINLDLFNLGSFRMVLSDEPRLIWETLVLKGDIPGFDLCLLLKHLRHVQEPVLAISSAKPRLLILCLLSWMHEMPRSYNQTCGRKMFWPCGTHPAFKTLRRVALSRTFGADLRTRSLISNVSEILRC